MASGDGAAAGGRGRGGPLRRTDPARDAEGEVGASATGEALGRRGEGFV